MSESKHTPGPWRRDIRHDTANRHHVYGPPHPLDGGNYAPICTTSNPADAELIAAAPDLLAALEEWVTAFGPVEVPNTQGADLLAKSRVAIAKAKGEPA